MWYDNVSLNTDYNYISSRIRLARNFDNALFPSKLSDTEAKKLIDNTIGELSNISTDLGIHTNADILDRISEIERMSMYDRKVLNLTLAKKKTPTGIILNDNEDISIVINGDDHIRLQLLSGGLMLEELWKRADRLDDYINEKFRYAFDEKYGYLTAYPTNVGTGMRANIVLHMPLLSKGKSFSNLILGLSRFGVSIKGVYGEGQENCGSLYDISNSKTLGHSEKEIIDQVRRVAVQLNVQEDYIRSMALKDHNISIRDEVYKSYGILKYARKLTLKEALNYLSAVMRGVADGLIKLENDKNVYDLMFGVQASNLLQEAKRPLSKEELDIKRADYIRENLGNI